MVFEKNAYDLIETRQLRPAMYGLPLKEHHCNSEYYSGEM